MASSPASPPPLSFRAALPRERLMAGAVVLAIGAAAWILARNDPSTISDRPLCMVRRWTGLYCPGCGSTRASHAILHGDIGAAWRFNPAFVMLGVPLVAWVGFAAICTAGGRRPRLGVPSRALAWGGIAIAAALILFMTLRNISWNGFDSLRPPEAPPSHALPT